MITAVMPAHLIQNRVNELERQAGVYRSLRDVCIQRDDLHGVGDACNDLREVLAEIKALRWAMGTA